MPDLDLVTADGPLRVFELLHDAKPVLLNLGEPGGFDIAPWADRVQLIDASYDGEWELPVLGAVTAPAAVLIRPDGLRRLGRSASRPGPARRAHRAGSDHRLRCTHPLASKLRAARMDGMSIDRQHSAWTSRTAPTPPCGRGARDAAHVWPVEAAAAFLAEQGEPTSRPRTCCACARRRC